MISTRVSRIFLDTETTGLDPALDRIVELAIVDEYGLPLLNTLVNPQRAIPAQATAIHGITDAMVQDAPTLEALMPLILAAVAGRVLVIYNASYDMAFLPTIVGMVDRVECAMQMAMNAMQQQRWPKLVAAAAWANHQWSGSAHRALADALAARSVYARALEVLNAP